jgi:hypothetical protein
MWDHKADVDALLSDFYEKFFGPAAAPMQRYFTMMDSALRDGNFHTGGSYDAPYIYPAALRRQAREYLENAVTLANTELTSRRIAIFGMTFNYLESFIHMLEAAADHNYAGAGLALDNFLLVQEKLLAHKPQLLNERVARTWFPRFYISPIKAGLERTTGANQFLTGLSYQWKFKLDPDKKGQKQGFWRKDVKDLSWEKINSNLSWSDQGKRYYRGEAWYRQSVIIPSSAKGKKTMIWFSGVDEFAEVWINEIHLGVSPAETFVAFEMGPDKPLTEGLAGSGLYIQPFEFNITSAMLPGKENVVSVRIVNRLVNELGTGGIVGPVMIYTISTSGDPKNVRAIK